MFDEAERRRILSWGRPDAEFTREECLHEWFARQAARTPDAVALSDEAGQVTYAELDRRTNRLARRLRRLGVGPESIVGQSAPALALPLTRSGEGGRTPTGR